MAERATRLKLENIAEESINPATEDTLLDVKTLLESIEGAIAGTEMRVDLAEYGGVAVGAGNALHIQPGTGAVFAVDATAQGDIPITLDSEEIVIAPNSSILHGQKTVATAGSAEALAGSTSSRWVIIKALIGNTDNVFVGDSDVTSANGYILTPGEAIGLDVNNLATVYLDVAVNGEGVSFIGMN